MNPDWIAFLQANGARLIDHDDRQIAFPSAGNGTTDTLSPVTNLSLFTVSGDDAATFLQGQLTCNINEIQSNRAGFAAYCNAKGKVVSTLLVCKQDDTFLLILPVSLLDKVMNKLRMYVLRADVVFEDKSDRLCLLGVNCGQTALHDTLLPDQPMAVTQSEQIFVRLPGIDSRYLIISQVDQAKQLWTRAIGSQTLQPGNSNAWVFQDLSAGIPWFSLAQSEEYIPQMLNIDKLGGISFNKGCYIGQEIVARTHYLGKAKRELFLAECSQNAIIDADTVIIDIVSRETAGKILAFQHNARTCRLLFVMPTEQGGMDTLALNNSTQDPINIIAFQ